MENDAAIINQLEDTAKRHVKMLQYHLRTHVHNLKSGVRDTASTLLTTDVATGARVWDRMGKRPALVTCGWQPIA